MAEMRQLIYSGHTGDHPVLVTDENGLRTLRFGTEERQTCIDLHKPWVLQLAYTQWMATGLLLHPCPEKFLLVGLGGGALAHFLMHHHPDAVIDVVEKERLVIEQAHASFHLPRHGLRIVHHDALSFLRSDPASGYHLIFLDIFGPGCMAPALFDPELYRLLLNRLHPEGLLVANLWCGDKPLYHHALQAVGEASGGRCLQMAVKKRSNVILLAFPNEVPRKTIKKVQKCNAEYQQRYGIDFAPFLKRLRRTNRSSLLDFLFR
jgi:spermidine synthase